MAGSDGISVGVGKEVSDEPGSRSPEWFYSNRLQGALQVSYQ